MEATRVKAVRRVVNARMVAVYEILDSQRCGGHRHCISEVSLDHLGWRARPVPGVIFPSMAGDFLDYSFGRTAESPMICLSPKEYINKIIVFDSQPVIMMNVGDVKMEFTTQLVGELTGGRVIGPARPIDKQKDPWFTRTMAASGTRQPT